MASEEVERLTAAIRRNAVTAESWNASNHASEELERLAAEDDLPHLREVLCSCGNNHGYLASVICLVLIRLGSAPDISLVIAALARHPGRDFYRDAVLGSLPSLAERDPAGAAPIIRQLLASHEPEDRGHAAALYPHAREFLPLGPLLNASRDPDSDVRITALGSLWAEREQPEVRACFLEALGDPDEMVVETALELLSAGEDVEAVPHLQSLRQHPSERIRFAVRAALIRLDRLPKD